MAIPRTSLVVGPAKVTQNGGTFFTLGNIEPRLDIETLEIVNDMHGKVDERVIEVPVDVGFVPEGAWMGANIAALWPYGNPTFGASVFGAVDKPMVIHGNDGAIHTIHASALTKMPSLFLSATKTMIGEARFRGVRKDNTEWTAADSLYSITSGAYAHPAFSPANIKVQRYTAAVAGLAGFTSFDTEDGWTIDFETTLTYITTDGGGAVDAKIGNVSVMAKCKPIGPTSQQIVDALKYQGAGASRGRSIAGAADLVITGEDTTTIITINKPGLKQAGFRFGSTVLRQGEIGFVATRSFAAGVPGALFTLAGGI
jgi:hypothetical protein